MNSKRILNTIVNNGVIILLMLLVGLIFAIPFLWLFLGGLRPQVDIFRYLSPFQWHTLFPKIWTIQNYITAIEDGFGRNLLNSTFIVAVQVPLSLLIDSMAAYALSWLPMPWRKGVFAFLMALLVIPVMSIMVPMYLVVLELGIQNTYWAMIIPWLAHVFGIFMLRQFMLDLPVELADAAVVDGASPFQIYWRVMIPNIKPALVTVGLIYFMWAWNSFYWPLIAIQDKKLQVIQVAVASYMNPDTTDWGVLFATATMATIPVVMLFLVFQRYYIQGIARSGIKG
jgi:ABC-type glycerol-3-phosphate transport system permease component